MFAEQITTAAARQNVSSAELDRSTCRAGATRIGVSSRGLEILRTLDDVFAALSASADETSWNEAGVVEATPGWHQALREPQLHAQ